MDFWAGLDPKVKRYLVFAIILLGAIMMFRACGGSESPVPSPPPGIRH